MAALGSRQDNQKNTHKIITDNGLPEVATRVDDPVTHDKLDILTAGTVQNTAIKTSSATVTTTAAQVLVIPLANRKMITIQNEGTNDVYIISSGSMTIADGIKISKNTSATFTWGPAIIIYMISVSGSHSVRFLEAA